MKPTSNLLALIIVALFITVLTTFQLHSSVDALADGDVTFNIQPVPTWYRRIRVSFTGSNFTRRTRFRLTNVTNCASGIADGLANDDFTQTEKWTDYDSKSFFVASFNAIGAADVAHACVSYDGGSHYFLAANSAGRTHFRLWGAIPTAKISPQKPTINNRLRVTVGNLPSGSRIALTQSDQGCRGTAPSSVVPGGSSAPVTFIDSQYSYVDFLPSLAVSRAYVCVATAPTLTDWTLAPVDETDVMIYRGDHYNNQADASDMITGRVTTSYFEIFDNANQLNANWIDCDGPLVQGKTTTCTLWIGNTTAVNAVAADFQFLQITDGAGIAECPFPAISQVNATHVSFDYTPQRWGRDGTFSFNYQNLPIKMGFASVTSSVAGLNLPNTTNYGFLTTRKADEPITRFLVLPPDTQSVDYAAQPNLLTNIQAFSGLANFDVTHGNPDAFSNGVLGGSEAYYATLIPSVTGATMTRTISGIASASRCKFNVRYAFHPDSGSADHTQTSLVGRATIVSRDNSPADIRNLKTFYIYVQGQSIIVTGADVIPLGLTGDIKTQESLSYELKWNVNQDGFRIELETYHTQQKRFYWFEPDFRCVPDTAGGPTLAADITALQNLYNAVSGTGRLYLTPTWRNAADTGFNGDPCNNGWTGIVCRNQRVTELRWDGFGLEGTLTTDLGDLTFLEVLRIANNKFTGALPANLNSLVRLRIFDVANNQFNSIPATFATSTTNLCLKKFLMQKNRVDAYPAQTIEHPTLEALRLEWNAMTGNVPNFTVTSVPLRELSVAHNRLNGYVPQNLPFDTLIILDLSDNAFDGPIPTAWSQFSNAQYIDISHNQITGQVPHDLAYIRSGNYLTFRAQDNIINGLVPRLPFESYDLRQNIIYCPDPVYERFSNEYQIKGLLYDECDFGSYIELDYAPYVQNDTAHLTLP